MKKIILTSAITIATVIASAQPTGTNQTLSSKELMKMEVVKIDRARANNNYRELATSIDLNLSQKAAMKAQVVKSTHRVIQVTSANDSSECPSCLALSKLSSKEQMKAQVIGLYKCSSGYNIINSNSTKCRFCGMRLTAKN